ncbi:MAG TPA: YjfB family protein [Rhodocyclaceae bacterium]|nr:YjfB family protein [Rhodocyclaceae bacterium]
MDVSAIAAAASDMAQTQTADAVQIAVLKKALDIESQNAMQLIQAASQVIYNNPPNLGNQVDTFA